MTAAGQAITGDLGRAIVRTLKAAGPVPWGIVFLPHLLSSATCVLHDALNAWHRAALRRDPGRLAAFAAPRGHGKSTVGVEVAALWHAAHCVRRYIVIVSSTATQAQKRLETIKHEVETNDDLRAAYPKLREAVDRRGHVVAWRDDEIALECGCRIVAIGAGRAFRGAKAGANRPDLILADDLEDEKTVTSDALLERMARYVTRTLLALAGPNRGIDALWVGTIVSRRALLNKATGAALDEGEVRPERWRAWTPYVFRAELDGTPKVETTVTVTDDYGQTYAKTRDVGEPLWRGVMTRADLVTIAAKIGDDAYAAEYLSDPAADADGMLARPVPVSFLNPEAPPLERLVLCPDGSVVPVTAMTRAAALDPQYATTTAHDPDLAAVVVAGQYGARTFLLDSWIGRDRHGQAGILVDRAAKWGCYAAGVEANGAQVLTADAAAALSRIPIVPMPSVESKITRALSLSVRLGPADEEGRGSCRVFILPGEGHNGELPEYLATFPHGRYDDPVDATVAAVELCTRVTPETATAAPRVGGGRSTS